MDRKKYNKEYKALKKKLVAYEEKIKQQMDALEAQYGAELLKKNGKQIGDKLKVNGQEAEIIGVRVYSDAAYIRYKTDGYIAPDWEQSVNKKLLLNEN